MNEFEHSAAEYVSKLHYYQHMLQSTPTSEITQDILVQLKRLDDARQATINQFMIIHDRVQVQWLLEILHFISITYIQINLSFSTKHTWYQRVKQIKSSLIVPPWTLVTKVALFRNKDQVRLHPVQQRPWWRLPRLSPHLSIQWQVKYAYFTLCNDIFHEN